MLLCLFAVCVCVCVLFVLWSPSFHLTHLMNCSVSEYVTCSMRCVSLPLHHALVGTEYTYNSACLLIASNSRHTHTHIVHECRICGVVWWQLSSIAYMTRGNFLSADSVIAVYVCVCAWLWLRSKAKSHTHIKCTHMWPYCCTHRDQTNSISSFTFKSVCGYMYSCSC